MKFTFHGVGFYQAANPHFGPSCWGWHDVIVCIKGRNVIYSREDAFELAEGDALLIPPDNPFHGKAVGEEMVMWVLHFSDYRAGGEGSPFSMAVRPLVIGQAVQTRGDRLLMDEFTHRWKRRDGTEADDRALALLGEALLVRFEKAFFHPLKPEPPRLRAAVEEALRDPACHDVAAMARRAGVSPSYFRQSFQTHYGTSPMRFLQQQRMEQARRLLSETSMPLKEIAQQVGYGEPAAFHRAFLREVELTPGAYRKRYGGVV